MPRGGGGRAVRRPGAPAPRRAGTGDRDARARPVNQFGPLRGLSCRRLRSGYSLAHSAAASGRSAAGTMLMILPHSVFAAALICVALSCVSEAQKLSNSPF